LENKASFDCSVTFLAKNHQHRFMRVKIIASQECELIKAA